MKKCFWLVMGLVFVLSPLAMAKTFDAHQGVIKNYTGVRVDEVELKVALVVDTNSLFGGKECGRTEYRKVFDADADGRIVFEIPKLSVKCSRFSLFGRSYVMHVRIRFPSLNYTLERDFYSDINERVRSQLSSLSIYTMPVLDGVIRVTPPAGTSLPEFVKDWHYLQYRLRVLFDGEPALNSLPSAESNARQFFMTIAKLQVQPENRFSLRESIDDTAILATLGDRGPNPPVRITLGVHTDGTETQGVLYRAQETMNLYGPLPASLVDIAIEGALNR